MMSVNGMRDFFGKKLGGHVFNAFSHLSPTNIGTGAMRGKIDRAFATSGMMGAGKVAAKRIQRGLSTAKKHNYTFGDWFSGMNVGETADMFAGDSAAALKRQKLRSTRAAWRIGVGATAGVAAISQVVAPDNPLGTTARSAIQLGGTVAAAGAIGTVSPWGGAAFAGLSALNAIRPGNNFGPF